MVHYPIVLRVGGSYAAHASPLPTYSGFIERASPGEYADGDDWHDMLVKALKIASAATVHHLFPLQMNINNTT